jgi:acylphosphatase
LDIQHRAMPTVTRHLRIYGRVQGVSFRHYTREEAQRLGVSGWVRNRRDGSVEAVISGPADAVEALIDWTRHGPRGARVTDVQVSDLEGEYEGFEIRPTD